MVVSGPAQMPIRSSSRLNDCGRGRRLDEMTQARLVSVVLVATVLGCGGGDQFGTPERVRLAPEAVLTSFGEFDDREGVEVLSDPVAAGLSESGRYLAVSDRSPPYLRILDRRTDAAWSFGSEGDGPGELRAADAVEFLGDSLLLVLARDQHLERYTPRGGWQGGRSLNEAGLQVASITAGCGGRIYVQGPPTRYRHLDSVPWVHELTTGAELSATSVLKIAGTDFHFGRGGLVGFDGTEFGVLYWDKARSPHVGFWIPCSDDSPMIFSHRASEQTDIETALESSEGVGGQAFSLPDTLFHGAAVRGSTRIWARYGRRPDTTTRATTFQVVASDRCRELKLVGEWILHDAHPDGLVVDRSHPFPKVNVLNWNWFAQHLTRVRCPD